MRKTLTFLTALLFSALSFAQLEAGDIAFIGYNSTGSFDPGSLSGFSWITLTDIEQGQVIYFTNEGLNNEGRDFSDTTATHITWTATNAVPTGAIIRFTVFSGNLSTNNGSVTSSSFFFNTDGDQIIAYTGSFPRTSNADFIAGLHSDYDEFCFSTTSNWSCTTQFLSGSNRSHIPSGLTNGETAISLYTEAFTERQNATYNGTLTGEIDVVRESINNRTNWTTSNTALNIDIDSYPTVTFCTGADTPTITLDNNLVTLPGTNVSNIVCEGTDAEITITGNLNDDTAWVIYGDSTGNTLIGSTTNDSFTIDETFLDPDTFGSEVFWVRAEGSCVAPGDFTGVAIIIRDLQDFSIRYGNGVFNENDPNPTPGVFLDGLGVNDGIGSFRANNTGVLLDETTGEIDIANSVKDIRFSVIYTRPATEEFCEIREFTTVIINSTTFTWTGNGFDINGEYRWDIESNWDKGAVPNSDANVIIPSGLENYPTVDDSATIGGLTMEPGATLVTGFGADITVNGTTIIQKDIANTNWHLTSTPFTSTYEDIIANNPLAIGTNGNIGLGVHQQDNPGQWVFANENSTGELIVDGSTVANRAFSLKLNSPKVVSFTPSNSDFLENRISYGTNITHPIQGGDETNFILYGNPFYANMNPLNVFTETDNVTEETVWIWEGTKYVTYNQMTPVTIAPTEAFFIETSLGSSASTSFNFKSVWATHENTDTANRQTLASNFKLSIEKAGEKATTQVFYAANKTTGFDNGADSKIFGGTTDNFNTSNNLAVFTELVTDNVGNKLAIQTLPDTFDAVIPVGIVAKAGDEIVFALENLNLPEGIDVFLEDKTSSAFVNLSEAAYTTTLEEDSNSVGKFYLHTSSKTLSTNDIVNNNDNVSIYKSAAQTVTVSGLNTNATVNIYSLLGKEVLSTSLDASNGSHTITLPNLGTGVYLVKVNSEQGTITKKIILN